MATFAIIGSVAARYYFGDFPREAKDLDVISPVSLAGAETHWYEELQAVLDRTPRNGIAPPSVLYTLKLSHCQWDVRWDKTMYDVLFFQRHGVELDDELYDILYKLWIKVHGAKKMSLEQTSEEFFTKHVKRKYDHDSVHASVAYYGEPLYTRILREGSEVAVDAGKLESMPVDDKIKLAREEVYATALERWIIPSDYKMNQKQAYARALKLTITSLTKGKFAKFIITNYSELLRPDVDYVARHKSNMNKLILLGE